MLEREEYIEQAYFFRVLAERLPENVPLQELLAHARDEVLATTRLPLAIDFLRTELEHSGECASAMARLKHYFTPFQTYVMQEAESDRSRFDLRIGVEVLRYEAEYRAGEPTPQGIFLYQFETLCRNRLRYDYGLAAIAQDPSYDDDWRKWILTLRRRIGMVDLADMIFVASQHYVERRVQRGDARESIQHAILFGEKEGKIALANRHKDPLYLFAALQRQLSYPVVPRQKRATDEQQLIPTLLRRVERLETRLKLLEEEQHGGGIDLSRFYGPPPATGDDASGPGSVE
jgi:hypothetical protein